MFLPLPNPGATALVVAVNALFNRIRGGMFSLPIDSKLFTLPFIMATSYFVGVPSMLHFPEYGAYINMVIFGICWAIWAYPGWAELMTLNTNGSAKAPTGIEAALLKVCGGNYYGALFLRMFLFLLPMGVIFGPAFVVLSVGIWLSYVIAWRVWRGSPTANPIVIAEWLSGAFWGLAMMFSVITYW